MWKELRKRLRKENSVRGTIDSWLVYKLTGGKEFRTDYSNASRTQLFHIGSLSWDQEVCSFFGIPVSCLAEVTDSDGEYGYTDFEGYFENPIPIRGVLGDSHGALFGQGCTETGNDQIHLRHRIFYYDEHWRKACIERPMEW